MQNYSNADTVCVGDQRKKLMVLSRNSYIDRLEGTVHVASIIKRGTTDIVRPSWLFDNIKQSETDGDRSTLILPLEPR